MKFLKLVRGVDAFGHDIKMNYKSEESYNSVLGGIITIGVYVLTLVLVVKAVTEIIYIQDPSLTEYTKPLTLEERADWVPLSHKDFNFMIGFATTVFRADGKGQGEFGIPPELGAFFISQSHSSDKQMRRNMLRNLDEKAGDKQAVDKKNVSSDKVDQVETDKWDDKQGKTGST